MFQAGVLAPLIERKLCERSLICMLGIADNETKRTQMQARRSMNEVKLARGKRE